MDESSIAVYDSILSLACDGYAPVSLALTEIGSGCSVCLVDFVAEQERDILPYRRAKASGGRSDRGSTAQMRETHRNGSEHGRRMVSSNIL